MSSEHPKTPHDPSRSDENIPETVRTAWEATGSEEPPGLVDQAILNRAHAAVAPSETKRPWSFGWIHTATTAALFVLSVTLLYQLRDEAPGAGALPPEPSREARESMELEQEPAAVSRSLRMAPAPQEDTAQLSEDSIESVADRQREISSEGQEWPKPLPLVEFDRGEPEEWLEAIREIRALGALEEARDVYADFRATYPGYPVPEDLISLEDPEP